MFGINGPSEASATSSGLRLTPWEAPASSYAPDRLAAEWPRVRIEGIDANLRRERDGSDRYVVRACVYLGMMLPADVTVDLLAGARSGGHLEAAEHTSRPLIMRIIRDG